MSHLSNSYPTIHTMRAARKFLEDYNRSERDYHCCYGHFGCSTRDNGPCLDETLTKFPAAEDE